MAKSTVGARAELEAALKRGMNIHYAAQGTFTDRPIRRSSVLVLFGALDYIPAGHTSTAVSGDLDILLTRRADGMRHHPGQIAFPGGGVEEEDADLAATALREAHEETGVDPSGVDVLGTLPPILIPVSNNLVTPVVAWWRLPNTVAADHTESVEVFRVPVADLLDPAARGTSLLRRGDTKYRGAAFELPQRFGGHTVWGFTGMILSSIFEEVGWAAPWDDSRVFPIEL